jgi:hypothetical protein
VVVIVHGQFESGRFPFMARPEGAAPIRGKLPERAIDISIFQVTASGGPVQASPSRADQTELWSVLLALCQRSANVSSSLQNANRHHGYWHCYRIVLFHGAGARPRKTLSS